jgi:hypothetical protein
VVVEHKRAGTSLNVHHEIRGELHQDFLRVQQFPGSGSIVKVSFAQAGYPKLYRFSR